MPRTLLVIDDNEAVRETLQFLLMRRGYTVIAADDGEHAIRLTRERHIDGAMVDMNMPGMNGVQVCRALREAAAAEGRDIAVWLMSGARSPEAILEGRAAGAIDLVSKPFDLAALFRQFDQRFGPPEASTAAGEPPAAS